MSLKKSRNRSFNVFNLSFLDIMSCGLGAVILIFLILKHGDSLPSDQEQLIYNDIKNTKESITISLASLETKQGLIKEIESQISAKKTKIENIQTEIAIKKGSVETIIQENKDIQKVNKTKMGRMDRNEFIKSLTEDYKMQGLNAMSISDITGIPRATVVRKLRKLVKGNYLSINKRKHYKLTGLFVAKLIPLQSIVLNQLSKFSTSVFNIVLL